MLLVCLACAGLSGCMTIPSTAPNVAAPTEMSARPGGDVAELPAAKTAKLEMALAEEMVKKGDRGGAIAQFEKARANDPSLDARAAHQLGILYDQIDQPARALVEFQRALNAAPRDAELLNDVGYCYYNRGEWAEAEKYLRQALELDPHRRRARMNLGMALAQQGKTDEALKAFGQEVSPAEAQANLGFILLTQGKREEAKAAYRRALELEPNLPIAQVALRKMDSPPPPPAKPSADPLTLPPDFWKPAS